MSQYTSLNDKLLNTDPIEDEKIARSPCISHCCLDDQDICLGCFRHLDEIVGWHSATNDQRLQILADTQERRNKKRSNPLV